MLHRSSSSPWRLGMLLACLPACSIPGTYVEPAAEQPAAIVHGNRLGVFSGISLGMAVDIRILAIDGESLPKSGSTGYPEIARVAPGVRELELYATVQIDGSVRNTGTGKLKAEFVAGKEYVLQVADVRDRVAQFTVAEKPAP
jgi:hypothetical protein